jgi:hypothetical protein
MVEHRAAVVMLDVVDELDAFRRAACPQQPRERALAAQEWARPQIFAVELQEIEGIEQHRAIDRARVQPKLSAQKIVDGASLSGGALDQLTAAFPSLIGAAMA